MNEEHKDGLRTPSPAQHCNECETQTICTDFPAQRECGGASAAGWVEAGMVCQACAGDAPGGKCRNERCVGGPIVRELVPADGVQACSWPDCGCYAMQGPGWCKRNAGVGVPARPSLWKPVLQPKALGGKDGVAMVQGAAGAEWVHWSDVAHLFPDAAGDWTPDTVPRGERAAEAIAEIRNAGVVGKDTHTSPPPATDGGEA